MQSSAIDGLAVRGAVERGAWFKGRQFTAEATLWAVRRHLMSPISRRDLKLMPRDRGVEVAHTTLMWTAWARQRGSISCSLFGLDQHKRGLRR